MVALVLIVVIVVVVIVVVVVVVAVVVILVLIVVVVVVVVVVARVFEADTTHESVTDHHRKKTGPRVFDVWRPCFAVGGARRL